MSEEQPKPISITEEVETVRVNVSREIYRLAREGEVCIIRNECVREVTVTVGDLSATKTEVQDEDGNWINPLPYCLYDLVNVVKKRK